MFDKFSFPLITSNTRSIYEFPQEHVERLRVLGNWGI